MSQYKITSQLKKVPFHYNESKMLTKLIIDGDDKHQLFHKCITENRMQIKSFGRRQEITNHLYQRLVQLDLFLLKSFIDSDIITSKFILVYAVAKHDVLFTEFLSEVYRNALLSEKKYISMDDFDNFFISKKETNLIVYKWSKTTIELLGKAYRKMLVDSTLGIRKKKNIHVKKMFIHPEISNYIKLIGDYNYLQAILGDR
jgi:hypothetical protein